MCPIDAGAPKMSGSNEVDHSLCLFFIDDTILVKDSNPLLDHQTAGAELKFTEQGTIHDNSRLIVYGESGLTPEEFAKTGYQALNIKRYLPAVEASLQMQIMRAYHWVNWDKQSKYCGRCGQVLACQIHCTEKQCQHCAVSYFPRFSPAVMVLIQKDDQLLLARSPHFPNGLYSAIAGFVDVGETAEQAAHREVKEELGIEITDLEYFGTQTWPFPDSFMIAFRAQYLSGELQIDPQEIEAAHWFKIDNIPEFPPSASIAKRLVESTVAKMQAMA